MSIILSTALGLVALFQSGSLAILTAAEQGWPAILAMALMIGIIGLLDDRKGLSAKTRLGTQLLVSVIACYALQPLNQVGIPLFGSIPLIVLNGLTLIGLLWWLNLFNFMDGLDGLAVGQALFMLLSALLALHLVLEPPVTESSLTIQVIWISCAALLGFLAINWHPARIFLGDCGSLSIGFMVFSIAMVTINLQWLSYHFWLIVGAMFVCDATLTLLVRIKNREKLTEAHRQHCYQVLKDHAGWSQPKVALTYLGFNLLALLPLALLAQVQTQIADAALVFAYLLISFSLVFAKKWAKGKATRAVLTDL